MLYHSHEQSGLGALSGTKRTEVLLAELEAQRERQMHEKERI
jgi:hypothetical protein